LEYKVKRIYYEMIIMMMMIEIVRRLERMEINEYACIYIEREREV